MTIVQNLPTAAVAAATVLNIALQGHVATNLMDIGATALVAIVVAIMPDVLLPAHVLAVHPPVHLFVQAALAVQMGVAILAMVLHLNMLREITVHQEASVVVEDARE